jgi:Kef-type K+ transport system membrane component KefB
LLTSGVWQQIFAFISFALLFFYIGYSLVIEYRLRLRKERLQSARGTTTTTAAAAAATTTTTTTTTTATLPESSSVQGAASSTVQQTVEEHQKQA